MSFLVLFMFSKNFPVCIVEREGNKPAAGSDYKSPSEKVASVQFAEMNSCNIQ